MMITKALILAQVVQLFGTTFIAKDFLEQLDKIIFFIGPKNPKGQERNYNCTPYTGGLKMPIGFKRHIKQPSGRTYL